MNGMTTTWIMKGTYRVDLAKEKNRDVDQVFRLFGELPVDSKKDRCLMNEWYCSSVWFVLKNNYLKTQRSSYEICS